MPRAAATESVGLIDSRLSLSLPGRARNAEGAGNVAAVELAEHHEWWRHRGGQELRRLLMERWDPIGVNDAPEAASEYDGYRAAVIQLLRG